MTHSTRSDDAASPDTITRRTLLHRLALTGAGGIVAAALPTRSLFASEGAGIETAPTSSFALPPIGTPADALRELAAGNRRFIDGKAIGPNRTMARLKEIAPKQSPFAAVLACADSRVPVEILFDQGFGDVFVCRAAGNIVTSEMLASLEFGTLVLGAKALLVLGHSSCGAVKATIAGDAVPGQISTLYHHIQPAVDLVAAQSKDGKPEIEAVAHENVRMQTRLLAHSSPVLGGLVKEGNLAIVGGMYDLTTGRVVMLD
ncbi:MAG: carbonic anhydrase [Polaromonas sp.]|nr:carbonic anhydrase [Gemmatimonadaceae bacterium]